MESASNPGPPHPRLDGLCKSPVSLFVRNNYPKLSLGFCNTTHAAHLGRTLDSAKGYCLSYDISNYAQLGHGMSSMLLLKPNPAFTLLFAGLAKTDNVYLPSVIFVSESVNCSSTLTNLDGEVATVHF